MRLDHRRRRGADQVGGYVVVNVAATTALPVDRLLPNFHGQMDDVTAVTHEGRSKHKTHPLAVFTASDEAITTTQWFVERVNPTAGLTALFGPSKEDEVERRNLKAWSSLYGGRVSTRWTYPEWAKKTDLSLSKALAALEDLREQKFRNRPIPSTAVLDATGKALREPFRALMPPELSSLLPLDRLRSLLVIGSDNSWVLNFGEAALILHRRSLTQNSEFTWLQDHDDRMVQPWLVVPHPDLANRGSLITELIPHTYPIVKDALHTDYAFFYKYLAFFNVTALSDLYTGTQLSPHRHSRILHAALDNLRYSAQTESNKIVPLSWIGGANVCPPAVRTVFGPPNISYRGAKKDPDQELIATVIRQIHRVLQHHDLPPHLGWSYFEKGMKTVAIQIHDGRYALLRIHRDGPYPQLELAVRSMDPLVAEYPLCQQGCRLRLALAEGSTTLIMRDSEDLKSPANNALDQVRRRPLQPLLDGDLTEIARLIRLLKDSPPSHPLTGRATIKNNAVDRLEVPPQDRRVFTDQFKLEDYIPVKPIAPDSIKLEEYPHWWAPRNIFDILTQVSMGDQTNKPTVLMPPHLLPNQQQPVSPP